MAILSVHTDINRRDVQLSDHIDGNWIQLIDQRHVLFEYVNILVFFMKSEKTAICELREKPFNYKFFAGFFGYIV